MRCLSLVVRVLSLVLALALGSAPPAWADNETERDSVQLLRQRLGDLTSGFIGSGCAPAVPGASLTLAAFACTGNVLESGKLIPVSQAAAGVGPLGAGNGTYWLALHKNRTGAVGAWTRQGGTHYLWLFSATKPAEPAGGQVFREVTVAGGIITASIDHRVPRSYALLRVYDITDPLFGAVSGASDNSAAIQAALNRQGAIYIPTGSFLYATTLVVKNNSSVYGNGIRASALSYNGTGDGIQINNPINSSTGAYITLRDFALACVGTPVVATKGCIADTGSTFLNIQNVHVQGNWAGIIFDQTEISSIKDSFIESATVGLWLVNGNAHNPAANQFFTNKIVVSNTQFNSAATPNTFAVANDGGATHEFIGNNFNGWGTWLRLASQGQMKYAHNEFEGAADLSPIAVHPTTIVNSQSVAAGASLVFDTNAIGNTATQKAIEIIGANTQNTLTLIGNTFNSAGDPRVTGATNLAVLNLVGNYTGDNNFYTALAPTVFDYQSGTWTPVGNVVTFTAATGTYIRVGRHVTVTFDVTWPATADTQVARISGLPFAPVSTWASVGTALIVDTTTTQAFYSDSNPYISLYTSAVGFKTNANMSTLRVIGSHIYFR